MPDQVQCGAKRVSIKVGGEVLLATANPLHNNHVRLSHTTSP